MGEAILSGVLRQGVAEPEGVVVSDIAQPRLDYLKKTYAVRVTAKNADAPPGADVVVLAVKPQHLPETLASIRGQVTSGQVVLSIVAGATIGAIGKGLSHEAVVRAMPNTPGQIGAGVTAWTATAQVSQGQRKSVRRVLSALGQEVEVSDEETIDVATALSGSGPAYVFLFMEALIEAGVHLGISRDLARTLVVQTVQGSGTMASGSDTAPGVLREQVTSPGGTTAEALLALEEGGFRATLMNAVIAAYEKAKLLGLKE